MAYWFYLAGSLCFVIGSVLNLRHVPLDEADEDPDEAWGYQVRGSGWVNGDETPDLEDE